MTWKSSKLEVRWIWSWPQVLAQGGEVEVADSALVPLPRGDRKAGGIPSSCETQGKGIQNSAADQESQQLPGNTRGSRAGSRTRTKGETTAASEMASGEGEGSKRRDVSHLVGRAGGTGWNLLWHRGALRAPPSPAAPGDGSAQAQPNPSSL